MNKNEQLLVEMLKFIPESNQRAILLQNFIAEFGPLSEETGAKVRELLKEVKK